MQAYVDAGFRWVCLTEHMAHNRPDLIPADEAPLDVGGIDLRFRRYFAEARRLQRAWAGVIDIYVGFETEAFSGYREPVAAAIDAFRPDLIVGSVHHVSDVPFDDSPESYRLAVDRAGGIEAFYCAYFDRQLELIEAFRPEVVGHFDSPVSSIPTTANAGRFRRSENVPIGTSSGSPSWILCSTSMSGHWRRANLNRTCRNHGSSALWNSALHWCLATTPTG